MVNPTRYIPLMDEALQIAQEELKETSDMTAHLFKKQLAHVRFMNLGCNVGIEFDKIPRSGDVGRLLGFVGTVIR